MQLYKLFFKRFLDILVSFVCLILFAPLFLVILVALFFLNQEKPFFCQQRPGLDGKIFKVIKFKTMADKKDAQGDLLPDAQRLTKVGEFLRKTSLDEIPQLLNVLKGDMSIIGPRPLLPEYLPLYNERQQKRHTVKPGITGWAQVNGRNTIGWIAKFEYDVWYVEHLTFLLDLKIFFLTLKKVFIREGINEEGQATTTKFAGNDE